MKYVSEEAILKYPIRRAHYDREHGNEHFINGIESVMEYIQGLPPEAVIGKTDLLGWLLAYHTKSFELNGRYLPHEVISWLINDLCKTMEW